LTRALDRVCTDHEPLIITRSGEQSVVMLALDDFKSLEETAYRFAALRLRTGCSHIARTGGRQGQGAKVDRALD